MAELADQVHASINDVVPTAGPVGFACTDAAVQLWSSVRPAVLAAGALVARFGDDLAGSGAAWSSADAAFAQHFQPRAER